MAAFQQPPGSANPPSKADAESLRPAPGHDGHIGYDPALIDSLLRDHAELKHLFARIGGLARGGDAHELQALLIDFKSRLEAHVLTENLRFYDCVEASVAGQPDIAAMVHSFRHEMNDIERAVIDFVRQYHACAFSTEERCDFAMHYARVGKLLAHRLATEEDSLYRLYRPG